MKNTILLLLLCIVINGQSQDTFSIVAVDEETGEVGSAGASCVEGAAQFGGVILISDIIPGRGAINGQATVCIPHINLQNGIARMEEGLSPQEILDWLFDNDQCQFGTNQDRQYGIVDFDGDGNPRSAAFTGTSALDHAGHRVGENYAIQGNILLGPEILDSMEARFVSTNGTLAEKLMAAMQGANVPGADSRCLAAGTSSTSAFLQVYKPDDAPNTPCLRLNVAETMTGVEPIDSLQVLFDQWLSTDVNEPIANKIKVFPNPAQDYIQIEQAGINESELKLFTLSGKLLFSKQINSVNTTIDLQTLGHKGILMYQLVDSDNQILKTGKVVLINN